jgi:predicted metalloprotease
MKKKVLAVVALSLFSAAAFSQTYLTQVKPADSKKWGYINEKGEQVIPPQFEKCHKFSKDGLAPIYDTKNRQYYFINTKGEKVATEVKDFKLIDRFGFDLEGFNDGLIPIRQGEKWGYLDTEGKLAIPAKYDHVTGFSSGHAVATLNKNFVILNTKGEESPVEGTVIDVKEFTENLAPYRAADKRFGFIDGNGKVVVSAKFESVGYFVDGLAWAKTSDGKVGFIDKSGEWVIQPQFTTAKEFDPSTGLARIKKGDEWGYVNKSGEIINVKDTDLWSDFSEGLAEGRKGGKVGFYDAKGAWVIEPQFEGSRAFKNGYAAVKKGDKWGMIDKQGNIVIEPKYDRIMDMELVK